MYAYSTVLNYFFVCRFDSGSNIVGFYDCLSNNETCPLSYRLNNDVQEGDVIDIESLSRMSDRSHTVNYLTTESMSVYFTKMANWYLYPSFVHGNYTSNTSMFTWRTVAPAKPDTFVNEYLISLKNNKPYEASCFASQTEIFIYKNKFTWIVSNEFHSKRLQH